MVSRNGRQKIQAGSYIVGAIIFALGFGVGYVYGINSAVETFFHVLESFGFTKEELKEILLNILQNK